jgi:hypothetical protein
MDRRDQKRRGPPGHDDFDLWEREVRIRYSDAHIDALTDMMGKRDVGGRCPTCGHAHPDRC